MSEVIRDEGEYPDQVGWVPRDFFQERVKLADADRVSLREANQKLIAQVDKLGDKVVSQNDTILGYRDKVTQLQGRLDTQNRVNRAIERRAALVEGERDQFATRNGQLEVENQGLQAQLEEERRKNETLRAEVSRLHGLKEENVELRDSLRAVERVNAEHVAVIGNYRARGDERLADLRASTGGTISELKGLNRSLENRFSRLLKSSGGEGWGTAASWVLRNAPVIRGILGDIPIQSDRSTAPTGKKK